MRRVFGDARLAVGATIGVLMVLISLAVLVGLVATGHTGDVGGLVVLVMVLLGGLYVLYDAHDQAGRTPVREEVFVPDPHGIYGPTVPAPEPAGPAPKPWKAVVAILALLLIGPFAIAIPMSILDDYTLGRPLLGKVVVTALLLVVLAVVGWVVRRVTTRRP